MTKSTGTWGLTLLGSPPISTIASLNAAKSTTAGTPVKSCKITLEGLNGISPRSALGCQFAILRTSCSVIKKPSLPLSAPSSRIRIEYGRWEVSIPFSSNPDIE